MSLDRQLELVRRDPLAIVGDLDPREASPLEPDGDLARPGAVDRVLDESSTTDAGRSTTSPAAMRSTVSGGRRRIGRRPAGTGFAVVVTAEPPVGSVAWRAIRRAVAVPGPG